VEKISMEINREKILNRIDDVSLSPTAFASLCGDDCSGLVGSWLSHKTDELPAPLKKRVNEVFMVMEQIILEMGKPAEEISPGELADEVGKRCP
jgi:hypothetical protein